MRIYLPATLDELEPTEPSVGPDRTGPSQPRLSARIAHTVTPALRAELPDEDEEGLEFAALLAAADDTVQRIAARPGAPRLRLVLAMDVSDGVVTATDERELAPSAVLLTVEVACDDIVSAHVDEPAAVVDVEQALRGDVGARERLADRDLLWYDASELAVIPR